jgi:hypothetical protein
MGRVDIHTGLNGFVLVDRIVKIGRANIEGVRRFSNAPVFCGIESLAQLGAMHVRFLTDLEKHAFLLKINHCGIASGKDLDGSFQLYGKLVAKSGRAFSYRLEAQLGCEKLIAGEFLFATMDYGNPFKREILQDYYQKVLACLQNDSKTAC